MFAESFGVRNFNSYFRFETFSDLWRYKVYVTFIIVVVKFYQIQTFFLRNMPIYFLVCNKRKTDRKFCPL